MLHAPRSFARVVPLCAFVVSLAARASAQPARPRVVSFDEALELAIAHHPSSRVAAAEVERARAAHEQTRAASLPRVDAVVSHLAFDSRSLDGQKTRIGVQSNQAALEVRAPIVDARAWADWSESDEHVEVAEASEEDEHRRLALAAGRAWTAVLASEHVLAARDEALRNAEAHEAFARARFADGIGTRLDVVRAQREVRTVRALLEQANADCVRTKETLGVLLGEDGPVEIAREATGRLAGSVEEGADDGLERRADLAHARTRANAARNEARHSYTDYLPTVGLHATGFVQDEPIPILPVSGVGYLAIVSLEAPLYDGGLRKGRRHARNAEAAAAEARLEGLEREARAEVRTAADRRERALSAHDDATAAAGLAHDAVGITRQRYADGVGTDLDVIDALREARDADISVAVAEHAVLVATLDLLAAAGELPRSAHTFSSHETH